MAEFDRFATSYASVLDRALWFSGERTDDFAAHKARYLARQVGRNFSGKILDYGCGIGLVSAAIARLLPAATVHGYDPSTDCIAQVDAALQQAGRFTHRDEDLDQDYDCILMANVMHHIPVRERPRAVQRLAERLSPCGTLVIIEHNPVNPMTRHVVANCALDEDAVLLRHREATFYLRRAGLQRPRVDHLLFFPASFRLLGRLEPLLRRLPFGAQYAAVAHR